MRKPAWFLNSFAKKLTFWDIYDLLSESSSLDSAWRTYYKFMGKNLPPEYLAIYLVSAQVFVNFENDSKRIDLKRINQLVRHRVGGYAIYGVKRFSELVDSKIKPVLKKELSKRDYQRFNKWLKMTDKA